MTGEKRCDALFSFPPSGGGQERGPKDPLSQEVIFNGFYGGIKIDDIGDH